MPSNDAPTRNPTLATIIVNYRTAALVIENLPALLDEMRDYEGSHVYIVDNASPGGDFDTLNAFVAAEGLGDRISVIASGGNLGFAGGNNIGFEKARDDAKGAADYIFCLNPDAAPRPGALKTMIDVLEAQPRAAIVGPQIQDENGTAAASHHRFPTILREFAGEIRIGFFHKLAGAPAAPDNPYAPFKTDWVSGAAFLARREAFPAALMDGNYFLYYEETDMMLGLKQAGWETWHAPEAAVVHIGGVSTGVQGRTARLPTFWFDSWRYYFGKNHGGLYAFAAASAKFLGALGYVVKQALLGRANDKPERYLADVFNQCLAPTALGRNDKPKKPDAPAS